MVLLQRRFLRQPPWVANELWRRARAVPSLDLRFAETKSLNDVVSGQNLITFTRASSGTYVGSDGLIKTAAVNEPRFDHNPTTGESLGLLVEESRTNLLLRSEEFDNASWIKSGSSVTANSINAPDGSLTADLLVENTANSQHTADQSYTFTQGVTYTASVYVKQGPGSRFLTLNVAGGAPGATFNLSTQTLVTAAGGQTNVSASINSLPYGWFRCVLTWTHALAFTSSQVRASLSNNPGSGVQPTYTGDGTSGIYIWGAQLEVGSFPTSYIPTTSSQVTRSADVASITGDSFTRWYRQDEMTVYAAYLLLETTGNAAGNRTVFAPTSPVLYFLAAYLNESVSRPFTFGPTSGSNITLWPSRTGANRRFAAALGQNNNAISVMGETVATDMTGAPDMLGNQSSADIGRSGGTMYLNGTLSRLTYWQSRLPNSILQDIAR